MLQNREPASARTGPWVSPFVAGAVDPAGLPDSSCDSSCYNDLPHFRQKAASSDSRLPQLRHLTLTTSFVAGAAVAADCPVIPRVAARGCCMEPSSISGGIPPAIAAPPFPPTRVPPATEDRTAIRSVSPPNPINVKPKPHTINGRYPNWAVP